MTSEIDFKSPCPFYNCFKEGRTGLIYWIDSNCKHHYKLTRSGKLKCIGYNCYNNYESDILGVKFNCSYHEIQRGAWHPNCSYQGLISALCLAVTTAFGKDCQDESDDFLENLMESLSVQREKYGFR